MTLGSSHVSSERGLFQLLMNFRSRPIKFSLGKFSLGKFSLGKFSFGELKAAAAA